MNFRLHMVFQVLGALILVGMFVTYMASDRLNVALVIGGFTLILAGAVGGVESEARRR